MTLVIALLALGTSWPARSAPPSGLEEARNRQDRPALEKIVAALAAVAASRANDADAQYQLARAQSYLAEVALELRDKETDGHSKRVNELTMRLARAIGL